MTERYERPTRILRRMLAEPGLIVAPGVADALNARLVTAEGYKAIYMTGGGTSAVRLGMPDVGLLTMSEMVDNAGRIVDATGLPVISDADTGYGNAINVMRTVRAFEKAGVAAIHIEDQQLPKRCGHLAGKTLVSMTEAADKIRAACDARVDDDFVIIARTDALAVEGLDKALERAQRYQEAGADMVFVEAPTSTEHLQAIPKALKVPALFNMASSGKTPFLHTSEIEAFGFKLAIYPNFAILVTIPAVRAMLRELRTAGTVANMRERMVSFQEWFDAVGMDEIKAQEARYGTPDDRRAGY